MMNEDLEWVAGVFTLPDEEEVSPTAVFMVLEIPSDVLLVLHAIDPGKRPRFADHLAEAMAHPTVGEPRRPSRIRVPTEELAEAALHATGGTIPVTVAAVPELDAVFEDFCEEVMLLPQEEPSYLAGGAISEGAMQKLFAAAANYYRAKPWKELDDTQIVRVDIAEWNIEGAYLCIIGNAGESFGLLFFASLDAYRGFSDPRSRPGETADTPAMISLSFDAKKSVDIALLREIAKHHWPVAGPKAYPTLFTMQMDREISPATGRDVRLMTACLAAFTKFFKEHRDDDEIVDASLDVSDTYVEEGLTVTLTVGVTIDE